MEISRFPGFAYEGRDEAGICVARAIVTQYDNGDYFLESIAVLDERQGQGYGRELMNFLLREYASVPLVVEVSAFGSMRLDDAALEDWYDRMGFRWDCDRKYMRREPTLLESPHPAKVSSATIRVSAS